MTRDRPNTGWGNYARVRSELEHLQSVITSHLQAAGVELGQPDPRAVWEAFLAFAAEPVDGVLAANGEDVLLFESGTRSGAIEGLREVYELLFDRQLHPRDAHGTLTGMLHVTCQIWFDVTPELKRLTRGELWGAGAEATAAWAARVEAAPEFQLAMAECRPRLALVDAGQD